MFKRKMGIALVASLLAGIAWAETSESAFQYIFKVGTLKEMKAGDEITYLQIHDDPTQDNEQPELDLVIKAMDDENLDISIKNGDQSQHLGQYPKSVGNPIHMYFLEKVVSDMAADTGGSPFYIRNRLKEALGNTPANPGECKGADGSVETGQCVVVVPFANDKQRDKMEDFADLQITFRTDEANPAWILGIDAQNPKVENGYHFSVEME